MKKRYVKDGDLPKNKQYVLIHLTLDNWGDSDDPDGNRYYQVAKFVRGLSYEAREKLPFDDQRKILFRGCDEWQNNSVAYSWMPFGESGFFGQEVDFWCELPSIKT